MRASNITISIDTVNDAFQPCIGLEFARILRQIADRIEEEGVFADNSYIVRDYNGNNVGTFNAI